MPDTNVKIHPVAEALEALARRDRALADLVVTLLRTTRNADRHGRAFEQGPKNAFESPENQDFEVLRKHLPTLVNNQQTQSWPMFGGNIGTDRYLPIRAFRADPSRLWQVVDNLRIFLSSGTTSGPEGRSRSGYSPEGLLFYRAGSIAAFFGVLETCVLPFSASILNTVSLSLIPTVEEWPDSSLAQMVAWFADIWETHYADAEKLDDVREKLKAASQKNFPVFVFGTAFHFVNLLDGGARFQLPPGSIVIETGGTKGRSRSVTRTELYDLIAEGFGIKTSRIVSEYGMCELASQAWDFVAADQDIPLSQRVFRFPWWVRAGVMSSPSDVETTGAGALTLFDPLRVDISKTALQTEDLAQIHGDQSFQLLGRVPRAPLKGCSLKVPEIASSDKRLSKTNSKDQGDMITWNQAAFAARAPKARRWLLDLLADREALTRLTKELENPKLAQDAVVDITSGLPFDADGFAHAAKESLGGKAVARQWLMIPPASHSLALIYPLASAFTAGLSVRVRLPEIAGIPSQETFLARAVELAREHGFEIKALSHDWRLGMNDLLHGESLLVFGDDDTCAMMESFAPGRVSAFGNAVSVTIVEGTDFKDQTACRRIVRDQLSLAQRGCLSSRMVIALGDADLVLQRLQDTARETISLRKPELVGAKTARAIEDVRLSQLGFEISREIPGLTLALKRCSLEELGTTSAEAMSRLDFVIPVIIVPEMTSEFEIVGSLLKNFPVKSLSLSDRLYERLANSRTSHKLVEGLRLVRLGSLGAPRLDGLHLGRRFFATEGSVAIN